MEALQGHGTDRWLPVFRGRGSLTSKGSHKGIFRAVDLFCVMPQWWIRDICQNAQNQTSPRVSSAVYNLKRNLSEGNGTRNRPTRPREGVFGLDRIQLK